MQTAGSINMFLNIQLKLSNREISWTHFQNYNLNLLKRAKNKISDESSKTPPSTISDWLRSVLDQPSKTVNYGARDQTWVKNNSFPWNNNSPDKLFINMDVSNTWIYSIYTFIFLPVYISLDRCWAAELGPAPESRSWFACYAGIQAAGCLAASLGILNLMTFFLYSLRQ